MPRARRIAFLLWGLDHFAHDLLAALPSENPDVRAVYASGLDDLAQVLAWADDPMRDALWFEFRWPPLPHLIARTDLGGRRVIVRVHHIEVYGSDHAAHAPWTKITDAIVVGEDVAQRLRAAAPDLDATARLHVIHNGLDLGRDAAAKAPDPFRIGWRGWVSLHESPILALQILHRLRAEDSRYVLDMATEGAELVAWHSVLHLVQRLGLTDAVNVSEGASQRDVPAWHAREASSPRRASTRASATRSPRRPPWAATSRSSTTPWPAVLALRRPFRHRG